MTKTCDQLVQLHTRITEFEGMMELNSTEWRYREEKLNEIIAILDPNMADKVPDCYFMTSPHFPADKRLNFIKLLTDGIIAENHGHALNWFAAIRTIFAHQDDIQQYFSDQLGRIAAEQPYAYLEYYFGLQEVIDQARLLDSTTWPKDPEAIKDLSKVYYGFEDADGVVIYLRSLAKSN